VASVTLSTAAATLVPGQSIQLTATVRDAAGNSLQGRTITWSTSAPNFATVSDGLVTAVTAGAAMITATSEGQNASAAITVNDGGVVSTTGGTVVAAGGKVSIVVPAGAVPGNLALTVAPANNAGATVIPGTAYDFGPTGTQFTQQVTIRIAYGTAQLPQGSDPTLLRLHLLDNNAWTPVAGSTVDGQTRMVSGATTHFSGYAIALIPAPVATVDITPAGPFSLVVGATRQLTATPKGASGGSLDRPVTWTSSADGIATVSTAGLVTAMSVGTATIRAESEGITASVTATVTAAPPPAQGMVLTSVNPGYHTCGLTAAGAAWCWGRNEDGELGDGSNLSRNRPVPIAGNQTWEQIAVGLWHTCALSEMGGVWCWGGNAEGEVGDGTFLPRNTPVQVLGLPPMAQISAGSLHTCGVSTGGQVWCWGDNRYGQLGDGTTSTRNLPVAVQNGNNFTRVSAGQDRTCGIRFIEQAWCWGNNGPIATFHPNDPFGTLGVGILGSPVTQPMQVVGNTPWQSVSAGYRYSCGKAPAGQVRCWGANNYTTQRGGQVGDGSLVHRPQPVLIAAGAETFTHVGAGFYSACALSPVGEAWCWGTNHSGEVGAGGGTDLASSTHYPTPRRVATALRFGVLDMGKLNACGITAAGETWCWGHNQYGQLGDGTNTSRSTPVQAEP
jgi:hypothetical protein